MINLPFTLPYSDKEYKSGSNKLFLIRSFCGGDPIPGIGSSNTPDSLLQCYKRPHEFQQLLITILVKNLSISRPFSLFHSNYKLLQFCLYAK